jgi:hypothetical protein
MCEEKTTTQKCYKLRGNGHDFLHDVDVGLL